MQKNHPIRDYEADYDSRREHQQPLRQDHRYDDYMDTAHYLSQSDAESGTLAELSAQLKGNLAFSDSDYEAYTEDEGEKIRQRQKEEKKIAKRRRKQVAQNCEFLVIQVLVLSVFCLNARNSTMPPNDYHPGRNTIVRATELERWFFDNNSVIIVSATMKLDQNLVRLTP